MKPPLDFPQIPSLITKAASIFTFVVFFFVLQHFIDLDFPCTCNKEVSFIYVFMFIPPLPFTFITILIQNYYQKTICPSKFRSFCCNIVCSSILRCIFIYLSMAAVWISTLLFDGDLFFCLKTSYNESQTQLPCRTNLTLEETLIKNKDYTTSLEIGLTVIGGIILFWNIVKCCRAEKMNCCLPYYREVYEDLLSEEVDNLLKEELKRIAKEKAKAFCNDSIKTIEQDELRNDNDNPEADLEETWREISSSDFYLTENQPRQPAQRRDPTPGLWTLPPEKIQLQILPTEEIQFRFLPSNLERDTHVPPGQGGDLPGPSGKERDSTEPLAQEGDPMPAPPDPQGDSPSSPLLT